ncbi:hypothetical protein NTE_01549 [Candidatus Nitrososphaera evergladensis SR1]|jgi:hypothetical protein|uniref:Uncharacterized protein n=1 Tax=Candidatus Nitrososphaera evergladensis SR1 TaxID=1459636 RepID=A0A075MS24_9ARCH|nr:hypothetical protein [Candidatus Nitrososphaera evergladensis]AIF83612.1 hypothetical protein NTE_01549 [Candidatus Nitrososphaera evergladensis SR1]
MITAFQLRLEELKRAGNSREDRMNLYRRYFASSRYNRLLIQQVLIRSAGNPALAKEVAAMEKEHNSDYAKTVERVKKWGYYEEFLAAVKEEDDALTRIIEAYDKRMKTAEGGGS